MHNLKSMLMKKLDSFADYYDGKELKDINPTAVDFMVKATETLQNISTIEAMDEYGDQYMDEMSGAQRRNRRTGQFMRERGGSYDGGNYRGSYDGSYDSYGRGSYDGSYNDGGSYGRGGSYDDGYSHDGKRSMLRNQLEETLRTSHNEEEREAARKMLKAMEGTK